MFNSKFTADLEGTLVQLDALYESYAAILKSAEAQLAALSLTDNDYKRLLEIANANTAYRSKISSDVAYEVLREIRIDPDDVIATAIGGKVIKIVLDKVEAALVDRYTKIYEEVIESKVFEKAVIDKLSQHQGVQESFNISEGFKALVQKVNEANGTNEGTAE
jgi:hypothetical protein